jgi:hypothetical protein
MLVSLNKGVKDGEIPSNQEAVADKRPVEDVLLTNIILQGALEVYWKEIATLAADFTLGLAPEKVAEEPTRSKIGF